MNELLTNSTWANCLRSFGVDACKHRASLQSLAVPKQERRPEAELIAANMMYEQFIACITQLKSVPPM
jgi:hypothetical protein